MPSFSVSYTTLSGKTYSADVEAETEEEATQLLAEEIDYRYPQNKNQSFFSSVLTPSGKTFTADVTASSQEEADNLLRAEIKKAKPLAFKSAPLNENPYAPDETNYGLPEPIQNVVGGFGEAVVDTVEGVAETGKDFAVSTAVGFSDVGGNLMNTAGDIADVVGAEDTAEYLKEKVRKQRESAEYFMESTADSPWASTIGRMAPTMAAFISVGGAGLTATTALGMRALTGGLVSGIVTDQLLADPDENLGNVVAKYTDPEERGMFLDMAAAIAANPDDTLLEKRLKLFVEGTTMGGVFGLLFDTPLIAKIGKATGKAWNAASHSERSQMVVDYIKQQGDKLRKATPEQHPAERILNHATRPTPPDQVQRQANNYWLGRLWDSTFTVRGFWTPEAFNAFEGAQHAIRQNQIRMEHITRRLKTGIDRMVSAGDGNPDEILANINEALTQFGYDLPDVDLKTAVQKAYGFSEDVIDEVVNARHLLDELSREAVNLDVVDEGLKEVIQENMGSWVRRSYRMFEDSGWERNSELEQKAIDSIAATFKRGSHAEKQRRAAEIIEDLVDKSNTRELNKYYDNVRKVNRSVLNKKQQLTPELRKWMGEIENPLDNLLLSTQKISNFVHKAKFYDELLDQAKGSYIFDHADKAGKFNVRISGTGTDLDGMFTSQGIVDAINERQGSWLDVFARGDDVPGPLTMLWKRALLLKGTTQSMKTVYSHQTHLRNFLGAAQMLAANGYNPLDFTKQFDVFSNRVLRSGNEGLDEYYEKMVRLGVVNTNVKVNEIRALMEEGILTNPLMSTSTTRRTLQNVQETAQDIYTGVDDLFKMTAFEKELDVLKAANPRASLEQLEEQAATIVKNTMPNYDRVPPSIKALRELPIGNFVAFPAEIFRTSYHIVKRGLEELASGNEVLVARGMKRLGGYLGSASVWGIAGTMSANMADLSDQEREAMDVINRPQNWNTTSTKLYMRDTDTGDLMVNDTYNLNTYATIREAFAKPIAAAMQGIEQDISFDEVSRDVAKQLFVAIAEPFVSQSFAFNTMTDILTAWDSEDGRTPEGKQLFPKGAPFTDHLTTAINELWNDIEPGSLTSIEKFIDSTGGDIDFETGEVKYNTGYEFVSNFTGVKFRRVNPRRSMVSALYKYNRDTRNKVRVNLRDATDPDSFIQTYINSQKAEYELQKELFRMADAVAVVSGPQAAYQLLTSPKYGIGKDKAMNLLHGRFTPVAIPKDVMEKVFQGVSPELSPYGPQLYRTIMRLNFGMMNTSLQSLRDNRNEEGELDPAKRLLRADGGVVDVPNAIDIPEQRINPYTGVPYEATAKDIVDPMRRLGFYGGGAVRAKYSAGGQVLKAALRLFGKNIDEVPPKAMFRATESLATTPITPRDLDHPTNVSFMNSNKSLTRGTIERRGTKDLGDMHKIYPVDTPEGMEAMARYGIDDPGEYSHIVEIDNVKFSKDTSPIVTDVMRDDLGDPMLMTRDDIMEYYNRTPKVKEDKQWRGFYAAKHSPKDEAFARAWRSLDDVDVYGDTIPQGKQAKLRMAEDAAADGPFSEDELNTMMMMLEEDEYPEFLNSVKDLSEDEVKYLKENIKPVSRDISRNVPDEYKRVTKTKLPETRDDIRAIAGSEYFSDDAINRMSLFNSRETIIEMSPDEYLNMAETLDVDEAFGKSTEKLIKLLDDGKQFDDLPMLSFENGGDGWARVVGHEGRHRAKALKAKGVTKMPVRFMSKETGKGPAMRWTNEKDMARVKEKPKYLVNEDGDTVVDFPVIFDDIKPKKLYHGSGRVYEKVRSHATGTGEGNQIYGVGDAYTAEGMGVATWYRDNMREQGELFVVPVFRKNGQDYPIYAKGNKLRDEAFEMTNELNSPLHQDAIRAILEMQKPQDTMNELAGKSARRFQRLDLEDYLKDYDYPVWFGDVGKGIIEIKLDVPEEFTKRWNAKVKKFAKDMLGVETVPDRQATLYEFELLADPDEFLDYSIDLGLHPKPMKDILNGPKFKKLMADTWDRYKTRADNVGSSNLDALEKINDPDVWEDFLNDYPDGSFADFVDEMVNSYGRAEEYDSATQWLYEIVANSFLDKNVPDGAWRTGGTHRYAARKASDEFFKLGIKGNKYLDGMSRQGDTDRELYNYVVYDGSYLKQTRRTASSSGNSLMRPQDRWTFKGAFKDKLYRATTTGEEATTDLLISSENPFEGGVHLAFNPGQANTMLRPQLRSLKEVTQEQIDEAFSTVDPDAFVKNYPEAKISTYYTNVSNPLDLTGVDIESFDASVLVPEMLKSRGVVAKQSEEIIDLLKETDFSQAPFFSPNPEVDAAIVEVAEDLLSKAELFDDLDSPAANLLRDYDIEPFDVEVFMDANILPKVSRGHPIINRIGNKFIPKSAWDDLAAIELPPEAPVSDKPIDILKHYAARFKANRELNAWFESFGYDSIVYTNTGEASLKGGDPRSLVVFRSENLKSTGAEIFDRTDMRVSKAMGGLVRNRERYKKGGVVDDPTMYRRDGSIKSARGYLGPVPNRVTGGTMTEVSIDVEIDGRDVHIPVMVPTLTQEEVEHLSNMELEGNAKAIPRSIIRKAIEHAKERMAEGKDVFYQDDERVAKAMGGPVHNRERYNLMPKIPQVMEPTSHLIPNPEINQPAETSPMQEGLILRSLKSRYIG